VINRIPLKDILFSFSSQFSDKIIGYISIVLLIRYLAVDKMGAFFFAASIAMFAVMLTDFGAKNYLTREAAQHPDKALGHLADVLSFRLPLCLVYLISLNGLMYLIRPNISLITLLTSIYVAADELYYSFVGLFLGLKRIQYHLVVTLISKLLLLGIIAVATYHHWSMTAILIGYVVINSLRIGMAYAITIRYIGRFHLVWNSTLYYTIPVQAFGFFMLALFDLVHFKIDTVMLGFMQNYAVVSTYESSYKILEASRFVIYPIGTIFFPLWSSMAASGRFDRIKRSGGLTVAGVGLLGIIIAVTISSSAGIIIPLAFGSKYSEGIPLLRILFVSLPMVYVGSVALELAKSIHAETKMLKVILASAALNILLNLYFIPKWSANGAAWSTVISETVFASLALVGTHREFNKTHRSPAVPSQEDISLT